MGNCLGQPSNTDPMLFTDEENIQNGNLLLSLLHYNLLSFFFISCNGPVTATTTREVCLEE